MRGFLNTLPYYMYKVEAIENGRDIPVHGETDMQAECNLAILPR